MKHPIVRAASLILLLIITGCDADMPMSTGGMNVHFCHITDCDEVFINGINGADDVACAFYEVNGPVAQALAGKEAIIIIDDHADATVATDTRTGEGIMHLKTCILDHDTVITGSYNPTLSMGGDYNNVLVIHSRPIARHYEDQLRGLTRDGRKHSRHNEFLHDGRHVEVYACPQDDCQASLLEELRSAEESIRFLLFTFTDGDVADALIEKHEEGLDVMGVTESFQSAKYNQHFRLVAAGVPAVLEESPVLQHNKVFIIDHDTVITGSYNPTLAAATINDETLIILHGESLAASYEALFDTIYAETQSFK
ncbi:hypothetical protein JXA12_00840 [Candidatus Woesearchaeota archaeon]|nr:hypothetical protein [Candidatus Woesearchaeota archaeon]